MSCLIVVSLLPIIFTSFQAAAGVSDVGNGGDGVQRDGKLILRDLAVDDLYKQLYVGTSLDSKISDAVYSTDFVGQLALNAKILIQKLTDVETIAPGAGLLLIHTLKQYQFVLVNNLPLLPDDEGDETHVDRVQFAIRKFDQIRLDRQNYFRLDPLQRVALMLHEAFYALAKPECLAEKCRQKSVMARGLTAAVFRNPAANSAMRNLIYEGIDLEPQLGDCRDPIVELTLKSGNNLGTTRFFSTLAAFSDYSRQLCREQKTNFSLRIRAPQMTLKQEIYYIPDGIQYVYRGQKTTSSASAFEITTLNCSNDIESLRRKIAMRIEFQVWQKFCAID